LIRIAGYDDKFSDEVVEVCNKCVSVDEPWTEKPWDLDDFRRVWLEWPTFNVENFGLALLNDRVVGYVFAIDDGGLWVGLCIDPYLDKYLMLRTTNELLSWCKYRIREQGYSGRILIPLGWEYGYRHRLISGVLGHRIIHHVKTWLMKFQGEPIESIPGAGEYKVCNDWTGREEDIVLIHNEAFRNEPFFQPVTVEMIERWFTSTRYGKPEITLLYSQDGDPVGFVVYSVFKAFDGAYTGLVDTLAVRPKYQGKGLGKRLLLESIREMQDRTNRIMLYVDEHNSRAIKLYGKVGFRAYRRVIRAVVTVDDLPS